MKFLDMFNEVQKGNFALTDEVIYNSIQNNDEFVPLYGGNKTHDKASRFVSVSTITKENKKITVFDGEGIIISLDGSAGSMTYKNGDKFALNHHAGFITLKTTGVVRLEFFALFYQNFLRNLSVSDGSKTLSLAQLYSVDFEIPDYDLQCRVLEKLLPIQDKINTLELLKSKYTSLINKQLTMPYFSYQAQNVKISKVIDCLSGNSGLTSEFIYNNINEGQLEYEVLSGATQEENLLGKVPKCEINGKKLRTFKNKDGLLVVRKGKAGKTRYLSVGNYTINDDAYILYIKDSCPYKIYLKWFEIQYATEIMAYSSSSDNGTWNKTGFFKNTLIDIPSEKEQEKVIELYDALRSRIVRIEKIKKEYEKILTKEVV